MPMMMRWERQFFFGTRRQLRKVAFGKSGPAWCVPAELWRLAGDGPFLAKKKQRQGVGADPSCNNFAYREAMQRFHGKLRATGAPPWVAHRARAWQIKKTGRRMTRGRGSFMGSHRIIRPTTSSWRARRRGRITPRGGKAACHADGVREPRQFSSSQHTA